MAEYLSDNKDDNFIKLGLLNYVRKKCKWVKSLP